MDVAAFRGALHRSPFEPFTIRLANGRTLTVPNSDVVAVGSRQIVVIANDGSWSSIDPQLIVSLDYGAPKPNGGNGSSK